MSSNEMTRVLNRLANSNDIVSRELYQLMESSWQDSLGWWQGSFEGNRYYSHNGAWGSTRSQVYSLPGGYTVTLVSNSPPANDVSFGSLLLEAHNKARTIGVSHDAFTVINELIN